MEISYLGTVLETVAVFDGSAIKIKGDANCFDQICFGTGLKVVGERGGFGRGSRDHESREDNLLILPRWMGLICDRNLARRMK